MKRACFVSLSLCLTTTFLWSQSNPIPSINQTAKIASPSVVSPGVVTSTSASQADPKAQARILDGYGKLPLSFEANQGQADTRVKFLSRTGGYTLFLTGDEAVLALRGKTKNRRTDVVAHIAKSSPQGLKAASLAGLSGTAEQAAEKLRARPDPGKGTTSVVPQMPQNQLRLQPLRFAAASMGGPTTGSPAGPTTEPTTDAVLRMKLRNANPAAKVTGADQLAGTSNYFIGNDPAKWRTNVPTYAKVKYEAIYPGIDLVYYGNQRELEYDFVLQPGANPQAIRLGIEGGRRLRLEHGDLLMTSAAGDVHLRSPHIYQEANGVRQEIRGGYVIKSKNEVGFVVAGYDRRRALVIDPVLAYSTYLGGSGLDYGVRIAVDKAGNAYVAGVTTSNDFPTKNAIRRAYAGGDDAFVTKINADGSALVYSTYLGGSSQDGAGGIAVDTAGNAYVAGMTLSADFPTVNAIQPTLSGTEDAFVTKINADGSALVYSTYLGGSSQEGGGFIAVDTAGNAYVAGTTTSSDFPTKNAIQPVYGGGDYDGFVTKINSGGTAYVYSTYLGGSGHDQGIGVAVDAGGNVYVTGLTTSTDFPTVNAIQPTYGGGISNAFVTKINSGGTAYVYSTYLGGSSQDEGGGIAVDTAGNAYVIGVTSSADFPIKNAIQPTPPGGIFDAFVTKINADGNALVYSTYLGGSDADGG